MGNIRRGSIKGASAADEAVLCTRERTYALKHVQTTNTVLLMPTAAEVCLGCTRLCMLDVGLSPRRAVALLRTNNQLRLLITTSHHS